MGNIIFKKMRKFYTNTIANALFKRNARSFCANPEWLTGSINRNYDIMMKDFKREPEELLMYQKQLTWRAKNLGMKELDLACGVYAKRYMQTLPLEECRRFEREVLELETPVLYKLVLEIVDDNKLDEYIDKDNFVRCIRDMLKEKDWAHP